MTAASLGVTAEMTATQALLLGAVGVVLAVGYLLGCRIWPYTNCPRCNGSGKSRKPLNLTTALGLTRHKAFRNCPRCSGTGRRLRLGRRLLNQRTDRRNR